MDRQTVRPSMAAYDKIRDTLHTGDLVLFEGTS